MFEIAPKRITLERNNGLLVGKALNYAGVRFEKESQVVTDSQPCPHNAW